MRLIFEKSSKGRKAVELPKLDVPEKKDAIPKSMLREDLDMPELSEIDVVRHYIALSRRNFGVDNGFYPLGSCTMKYNPKINEDMARLPGFAQVHPLAHPDLAQGALGLIYELEKDLCEITGMSRFTLQPAAGSHGELTGVMIMKKYFRVKGENRTKILIPDSAHGTNPASAAICNFEVVEIKSDKDGCMDLKELRENLGPDVAGLMLTNPNTLGIADRNILEIARLLHDNGSLFYCDGANFNAIVGIAKIADMGFDIVHLNLHKTFSTPHGCGGPGAGPVGVTGKLADYLPVPLVEKDETGSYYLKDGLKNSIGKVRACFGNFGVLVRAYTYIKSLGREGLREVGENAVLNANYLMSRLKRYYRLPHDTVCKHEFVLSDEGMPNHVTTSDIAKRLLDYGFHSPTIYFPMIVHGSIMIEPTETESKQTLDAFASAMILIRKEAEADPELVKSAPHSTVVRRLDAVKAARNPVLKWEPRTEKPVMQ